MVAVAGCVFQQKKDNRWIARYMENGKRKQVYGRTKEEAIKKRQEKMDELNISFLTDIETMDEKTESNGKIPIDAYIDFDESNELPEDTGMTLSEWLLSWLELFIKPHKDLSTYKGYKVFVNKHIIPAMGNIKLRNLTPDTIQVFINTKTSEGRLGGKDGGMSPQSMRNMQIMLKSALGRALEDKLISYNPMDLVNSTKAVRKEKRILNHVEEGKLVESCCASDKIMMYGIVMALRLGLNIGELLALKWSDIDQNRSQVFIRHKLKRASKSADYKSSLSLVETNAVRVLYNHELSDEFFTDMETYQNKSKAFFGFIPDTVIANSNGLPVEPSYYYRQFKKMLDTAGIARANFDILRNTFAVGLFRKGFDSSDVQKILGLSESSRTIKKLMVLSAD